MNMMNKALFAATVAAASLLAPNAASAVTLLDLGAPTDTTVRGDSFGPGQMVSVAVNTTLNSIGFYTASPSGGQIKYVVFDGANDNLLFSITSAAVAGDALTLNTSPTFAYNLLSGSSYYFGVISDSELNVGFSAVTTFTQNGLTASGPNSNYNDFTNPRFANLAGATINLVLTGTQGAGAVPETATWGMMIAGFGMMGAAMRTRRRSTKVSFA